MTFILNPGDPVPAGAHAGPWRTLAVDTVWLRVDTAGANKFWAMKTASLDAGSLTATSGTDDPSDLRIVVYVDHLVELLMGVVLPASPLPQVDGSTYAAYIGPGGLPDGTLGIQLESSDIPPLGGARLPVTVNSNTHVVADAYYTINFYDAPWVAGKPAWTAGVGGDPDTFSLTVDPVAVAASYTSRAVLAGVSTGFIPLPDLSTFKTWADGTIGWPLRGILAAAVNGLAPAVVSGSGASFFGPSAGCDLLCRLPRYRYFDAGVLGAHDDHGMHYSYPRR